MPTAIVPHHKTKFRFIELQTILMLGPYLFFKLPFSELYSLEKSHII